MAKSDKHREPSQRQLRVGEALRHALAQCFERGGLRDPALADAAVTVTEVRMSPDLKRATAFVMPLGGRQAADVVAGLGRSAGYLRREIAKAVPLRIAPELTFALDSSFDQASRIAKLLDQPEVARDLHPEEDGDEDGA
ncbi:MAG: 30S ribosome-binding factor RbfA [Stellaceae bacterium]